MPFLCVSPSEESVAGMARLMREQPALALQPAAIAGERTVAADHAMARHDNADRICPLARPTARTASGLPIFFASAP